MPGEMEQQEEQRQFLEQDETSSISSLSVLISVDVELPRPLSKEFRRVSFSSSSALLTFAGRHLSKFTLFNFRHFSDWAPSAFEQFAVGWLAVDWLADVWSAGV